MLRIRRFWALLTLMFVIHRLLRRTASRDEGFTVLHWAVRFRDALSAYYDTGENYPELVALCSVLGAKLQNPLSDPKVEHEQTSPRPQWVEQKRRAR